MKCVIIPNLVDESALGSACLRPFEAGYLEALLKNGEAPPMTVFVFRSGSNRYGYTLDESGANLPKIPSAPWRKHSTLNLDSYSRKVGIEAEDVLSAIGRYGYSITEKLIKVTPLK